MWFDFVVVQLQVKVSVVNTYILEFVFNNIVYL